MPDANINFSRACAYSTKMNNILINHSLSLSFSLPLLSSPPPLSFFLCSCYKLIFRGVAED